MNTRTKTIITNNARVVAIFNASANIIWDDPVYSRQRNVVYNAFSPLRSGRYISERLKENLNRLAQIQTMGKDWNGNGADPFSKELIDKVRVLLLSLTIQPEVFPTAADSIQLEYDGENGSYLEFQIYEDTDAEIFLIDRFGNEKEWTMEASAENINAEVIKFYE